jgi:uncharacterized protein (TIGR02588 family)
VTTGRGKGAVDIPPLEWAAGALGLALFLGSVAFLVHAGLAGREATPEIGFRVEPVRVVEGGFEVAFVVVNRGGATAAEVAVEGQLLDGERRIETSELTFDFVPARSERRGALRFARDPRQLRLELRARSWREP